jgi:hypothetical protein
MTGHDLVGWGDVLRLAVSPAASERATTLGAQIGGLEAR